MAGITIFGVTGRMGQALVRALREAAGAPASGTLASDPVPASGTAVSGSPASRTATSGGQPMRLCGAVAASHSSRLGQDAAVDGDATGVLVTADPRVGLADATVAIDFSVPQCVAANARACVAAGVPLLVGTTGFDPAVRAALESAAAVIPVLIAPNTSVGVNVVAHLVKLAARALASADVEISEAHHRMKRDAPSGTALALGEIVARARGQELKDVAVFERHGAGLAPRRTGDIGFAVLRAGDIVGDHTVTFAVAGERVEITHRATDRITFARGALRAAEWLAGRPPGLYAMDDVIGL